MSIRIALWNASALDNIGDRLLDHINRRELGKRIPTATFQTFTPWPSLDLPIVTVDANGHWCGEGEFEAVVIGGGALLIGPPFIHPSLQTSYLGPYPERFCDRCPVAWNAICCDGQFVSLLAKPWRDYVRAAGDRLSYATVRNVYTAEFLHACGVGAAARVVPDPVTLLHSPSKGQRKPRSRRRVGIQFGASGGSASFLAHLLTSSGDQAWNPLVRTSPTKDLVGAGEYSAKTVSCAAAIFTKMNYVYDLEVAPFGQIYSDAITADQLAREMNCKQAAVLDPLGADVFDWMTSLDCVIVSRLHACVLALVSGTPFVAIDPYFNAVTGTSKLHGFMSAAGLESVHIPLCNFVGGTADLEQAIERAISDGGRLKDVHASMFAAASEHFDALADRIMEPSW